MKSVLLSICLIGGAISCLGWVLSPEWSLALDEPTPETYVEHRAEVDRALLDKIRPLFPEVRLERRGSDPFFAKIQEVARVAVADGKERLIVWVHMTIPAARIDHGCGELLIFKDANDALPVIRRQMHTLPVIHGSEIRLIENRWVELGAGSPLVSLVENESLNYFREHGLGSLMTGLSSSAVCDAMNTYLKEGRKAFVERVPIAVQHGSEIMRRLPARITQVEIYPSLVQDIRNSKFKYSTAWEATIFVRLTPADRPEQKVVLEIGGSASSEGITSEGVHLIVWDVLQDELTDRPAPRNLAESDEA